jgi:hypothetical protein
MDTASSSETRYHSTQCHLPESCSLREEHSENEIMHNHSKVKHLAYIQNILKILMKQLNLGAYFFCCYLCVMADSFKMDLKEIEFEGVGWIHVTHNWDKWWAVVMMVMNRQVV